MVRLCAPSPYCKPKPPSIASIARPFKINPIIIKFFDDESFLNWTTRQNVSVAIGRIFKPTENFKSNNSFASNAKAYNVIFKKVFVVEGNEPLANWVMYFQSLRTRELITSRRQHQTRWISYNIYSMRNTKICSFQNPKIITNIKEIGTHSTPCNFILWSFPLHHSSARKLPSSYSSSSAPFPVHVPKLDITLGR